MARMARVVVAGYPHHITQRGNRRQQTFFCSNDYAHYLELMSEYCRLSGTEVWAYCLMPNHVHLVMVPGHADGLREAIGEAHRRYTRRINFRENWRGHLWQERFHSFPMDERYLMSTVRYVENNPVKAKLCRHAGEWRWSSAQAHLNGVDDTLVKVSPMLERIGDWEAYLSMNDNDADKEQSIQMHSRTGRPLGSEDFLKHLEIETGLSFMPQKPCPKSRRT